MVRRLKSELPPKWDGTPRFPKRILQPLEVAYSSEVKREALDLDEEKTVEWRLPAHHAETICLCFFSGAWERNIEWDA
jgi:hypothetical protein